MTLLWIDATNGAAGDMLLGALFDAGADQDAVQGVLRSLTGGPIGLRTRTVRRHGLRATKVDVLGPAGAGAAHRGLDEVSALIERSSAHPTAVTFAKAVFHRLAAAESVVHGVDVEEVAFHEVGAVDSIADILGCAVALHASGLLEDGVAVVGSPLALGGGTVRTRHGTLPVPVPAVLQLVTEAGIPTVSHSADFELCTPTGAALLAELVQRWGPLPGCVVRAHGSGAGTQDPVTHPNTLRVVLADSPLAETDAGAPWRSESRYLVETTIDDMEPRLWPGVLEALHQAGAHDAWLTPVVMRKGRPGHVLTALAPAEVLDGVCATAFATTTTLGLRVHQVSRRSLDRDVVTVAVDGHLVSVKRGLSGGRVLTVQPEFDEAQSVAASTGRPLTEVLDRAREAARAPTERAR